MDALEGWKDFNVAMAGATAALAGLAIVAASVNIKEIVTDKSLTSRLAAGIAGLVLAIASSAVGLIPGIPVAVYGVIVIALALAVAAFGVDAAVRIYQNRHPENRLRAFKSALNFSAPASYLVGGVLLVAGIEAGLFLLAVGSIVAIVSALLVSWIVLVEVLR